MLGGLDISQFNPEQLHAFARQVLAHHPAHAGTEPSSSLPHAQPPSSSVSQSSFPPPASARDAGPPFSSGLTSSVAQAQQSVSARAPSRQSAEPLPFEAQSPYPLSQQAAAPRVTPYQSQRVQQTTLSPGVPSHLGLRAPPSLSLSAHSSLGFPPLGSAFGPSASQPFVGFDATRAPQTRPRVNMGRQQSLARTGGGRQRVAARTGRATSQVIAPSAPEGTQKDVASTCVTAGGLLRLRIHVYPPIHVRSFISPMLLY